jgi:WD40 repeat protein
MRLLEEKAKWVEVMNEANSVYDKSMQRMGSVSDGSFTADLIKSKMTHANEDLSSIIKPEYL